MSPVPTETSQETHSRQRLGRRCHAPGCDTLVIFGQICDVCLRQAAIDLAQRFERELIDRGFVPGSADLRATLAGCASARSQLWYETETPLGRISYKNAVDLRDLANTACVLIALGGVAALEHLPLQPNFRLAVARYSGVPEFADPMKWRDPVQLREVELVQQGGEEFIEAYPVRSNAQPGIALAIRAATDGPQRMANLFGALPRTHTTVLATPEQRFDLYALAVLVIAAFLLLRR